jgi:hypothetical protein
MKLTALIPVLALVCVVPAAVWMAARPSGPAVTRNAWLVPAALSAAFLGLSLVAVVDEGVLGFWENHNTNYWGNQVWVDLLLAFGLGWYLLQPRLRAHGQSPWGWLLLMLCTGSIGLLAALARVLYLDSRRRVV